VLYHEKNKYQVSDYFFEISYSTVRIIKIVPKAAPNSSSGFLGLMSLFSPVYIQAPAITNNFQDNNHERLSKQLFELLAAIGKLEQAPRRGLLA
jgi:hypothetical protein